MRYWFSPVAIVLLFASCQTGVPESNDRPQTDTTGIENIFPVPSTSCYERIDRKDTFRLKIESYDDIVSGTLSYLYHDKDQITGSIRGLRYGDTLIGEYTFEAEGKKSVRQIAFLLNDIFAREGHADMEDRDGKMSFANTHDLSFEKGIVMVREDCFTNPVFNPDAKYTLAGTWELNFIQDTSINFDSLYQGRKPGLLFTYGEHDIFSGHTGCNSMRGYYHAEDNSFKFREPIAMTKMSCEGDGEKKYLILLKKVNRYSVNDSSLTLFRDDQALVRFSKK